MSDALELEFQGEPRRPAVLRLLADERLARRAATGDRAAFAVVVERHHQALYRYCRALLRHEEDARDALQNTLTRAMQALEGEERDIALRPWLHRIAHNEAISLVRRRRPHRELEPDLAGTAPGADTQAIASERMRDLLADLEELPDRQRSALVLRELNDFGYADIGAALETSEQAARQAVYEARVMLAELQEGRAMPCDEIRHRVSARDGRLLRPRRVRAHLRSCAGCRAFRDAIGTRRTDLGALAPPLAPAASAALLHGVLGTAGGSGGSGVLAGLGLGHGATTAAGAKGLAVIAAAATVGGGAVVLNEQVLPHPQRAPAREAPLVRQAAPAATPAPGTPRAPRGAATAPRGHRLGAPEPAVSGAAPAGVHRAPAAPAPAAPVTDHAPAAGPAPSVTAPAQAPAATHESPAASDPGPRTHAPGDNSAGGNPSPGTPPAHSNAGGNGKGKAKGLAKGAAPPAAAPPASDVAAPPAGDAAPPSLPATAAPQAAAGQGNGKAKGHARSAPKAS